MRLYSGRSDQRKASINRRQDARVLQTGKRRRGAMYLLGYAVECSLKAKLMERYGFDHLRQLQDYLSEKIGRRVDLFTHSLDVLMNWTEAQRRMDGEIRNCWGVIRKWNVSWRYDPREASEGDCTDFFDATGMILSYIQSSI